MSDQEPNTDKLIQKIIDRQAELVVLSDIIKSKKIKKFKDLPEWLDEIKDKNKLIGLSKAV